ncbi:hypothetical protein F4604DRAFT_1934413 [Suillus subluteus]|nr:hypothetical protein F4604DRAFT_1934413 [Suillus subluteus]
MDQIIHEVTQMAHDGHLQFPAWQAGNLPLAIDVPNHDIRLKFHSLPFHFLQPGNSNGSRGRCYLNVDATFSFQSLEVSKFFKQCDHIKSPEDSNVSLIYLCPKGGDVIGPLIKGSIYPHHYFANHIATYLIQRYEDTAGIADHFTTLPCAAACPPEDSLGTPASSTSQPSLFSPVVLSSSIPSTPTSSPSFASLSPHPELPSTPATSESPAAMIFFMTSASSSTSISSSSLVSHYSNCDRSASPQRRDIGPSHHLK